MSNIQKILDSLQPYVIGIRYIDGTTPVVDTVFKDGWNIPEDTNIKKVKGNDELNYYMIFSDVSGIGLDELLSYVEKTIKLNQDREKKHELLKTKVNELKEVFKKHNLSKLSRLKFTFGDEELVPSINDFELEKEVEVPIIKQQEIHQQNEPIEEEIVVPPNTGYLNEKGEAIEMTDEDREILEEEARAERNRKLIENKRLTTTTQNIAKKVELPPKRKIEVAPNYETDCDCGPNEACDKCIDKKDL